MFFARVSFYIWRLFSRISWTYNDQNAYAAFLRQLRVRDEPFGLISFNYDTMLDQAMGDVFGVSFASFDSYLAARYVKPHGSVNWLVRRRGDDATLHPELPRPQPDVAARIRLATWQVFGRPLSLQNMFSFDPRHPDLATADVIKVFDGQYCTPLVLMPLTAKLYSAVERLQETIIDKGVELMRSASEVFLIGYRAADDVIFQMLGQCPRGTPVHVIGLGGAANIRDNVIAKVPWLVPGRASTDGFLHFIQNYG